MPARIYDRFIVGPGITGYVYRYYNRRALAPPRRVATGLELSVQLEGEWLHEGRLGGTQLVSAGQSFGISPAEVYGYRHVADSAAGLQVGFVVYTGEVPELAGVGGELRLTRSAPGDARFAELCRAIAARVEQGPVVDEQTRGEIFRLVHAVCEVVPPDPVLVAKRELDRHFSRPLYMEQIAEAAQLHATTFARHFARRFGVSPARYRLHLRLNEACRLLWMEPWLQAAEIAARVGFEDLSYFYRAFRELVGLTPLRYAARELRAEELSAHGVLEEPRAPVLAR
jgi:AraC-like DNA-binding protein